jgi:hypothetical protein
MTAFITKPASKKITAELLERDSQKHANKIREIDGAVAADVDSIREVLMRPENRPRSFQRPALAMNARKDSGNEGARSPQEQLPSPVLSVEGTPARQAVKADFAAGEACRALSALKAGRHNEMVKKMLDDLALKRESKPAKRFEG